MFSRAEVPGPAPAAAFAGAVEAELLVTGLFALVSFLLKSGTPSLLEALGDSDLSMTQVKLLCYLERAERELTLKELAELLPISLPAASRAVDELVHRGFVVRNEDSLDRRMKRVRATEAGRMVSMRVDASRLIGLQQFAASLDSEERTILAAALSRLLDRPEIAAFRPKEPQP
jgi:DNA-binding MarR family transcriptional regulator